MPGKLRKSGRLANAIAEAALGPDVEKELDESFDDDTKAKVAGGDNEGNEFKDTGDEDDDWKLDFETEPNAANLHQRSVLRTQNAPELGYSGLDDRYKGKRVSRKSTNKSRLEGDNKGDSIDEKEQAAADLGHLLEGGSDEESEKSDLGEESEEGKNKEFTTENGIDFGGISEENGSSDGSGTLSDQENGKEAVSEDEDANPLTIVGKKDSNEYLKGLAIKSQMMVWDRLLEYRIQLQKILQCMNKFPHSKNWEVFNAELKGIEDDQHGEKRDKDINVKKCQSAVAKLNDLLLITRHKLSESNPETNIAVSSEEDPISEQPSRKRRKVKEYESLMQSYHEKYIPFRNETIERWNDRTQIAMGSSSLGSGKQKPSSFGAFELSTLKQIQHILSDTPRLVRRTQYKRTPYKVLGETNVLLDKETDEDSSDSEKEMNKSQRKRAHEEYDCEIFDDDDFYHNLLRELIERKSGCDENQQDNWLQIQKLRSRASRRKVDTRASKGRKIRYDIHAKLVNFMAPVINSQPGQIPEEAKNELFNSLFKS